MGSKQLIELQLRQFTRLLETKRLSKRDSFMVIFSDYPSAEYIQVILDLNANMSGLALGTLMQLQRMHYGN